MTNLMILGNRWGGGYTLNSSILSTIAEVGDK